MYVHSGMNDLKRSSIAIQLKTDSTLEASAGNYASAAAMLVEALKHEPTWAALHNNYAQILLMCGDRKGALVHFRKCLRHDKSIKPALVSAVRLCIETDSLLEGKEILHMALSQYPRDNDVLALQIAFLNAEGFYHLALDLAEAIYDAHVNEIIVAEIVVAMMHSHRYLEALTTGLPFCNAKPTNITILNIMSICYQRLGMVQKALDLLSRDEAKQHPQFLLRNAELYALKGDYQTGSRLIKAFMQQNNVSANEAMLCFSILFRNNETQAAWSLYKKRFDGVRHIDNTAQYNLEQWDGHVNSNYILVHKEQGIGDYLVILRQLVDFQLRTDSASRFYLETDERLANLICLEDLHIYTFAPSQKQSVSKSCSCQINLLDLSIVFHNDNHGIYYNHQIMGADLLAQRIQKASQTSILSNRSQSSIVHCRKNMIGLSWRTLNQDVAQYQDISLADLLGLVRNLNHLIPSKELLSLQYLITEDEWQILQEAGVKVLPEDLFTDLGLAFFLTDQCSQVITISNLVAHMAGTLGIPTILLIPPGSSHPWYWDLRNGNRSSLYPTVTIIEKGSDGSFESWQHAFNLAIKYLSSNESRH